MINMSEKGTCPTIEASAPKSNNFVMTKRQLERLVERIAWDAVKSSGGSGFTKDNADPHCTINPMLEAFRSQMKESNIEFAQVASGLINTTNPSDLAVDTETAKYRYVFRFPHVTRGGSVINSVAVFNVTTYWYANTNLGRNEINTTVEVMAEETYSKSG